MAISPTLTPRSERLHRLSALGDRMQDGMEILRPASAAVVVSSAGDRIVGGVGRLGRRTETVLHLPPPYEGPVNRFPRGTALLAACALVLAALFGWGVLQAGGGTDNWLKAPGATNAQAAYSDPVAGSPVAAVAPTAPASVAPAP